MTDDLHDLLARRANRARTLDDADHVAALVVDHARKKTRSRRNRIAVASGAAVLVAAATVSFAIADGGSPAPRTAPEQAGGGPSTSTPATGERTAIELPQNRPLHGTATGHGVRVRTAQKRAEKRAEMRAVIAEEQRVAARRTRRGLPEGNPLVHVGPAPASAEISIGLVPNGYVYIGSDGPNSFYGLPGTSEADCFAHGIVVDVHLSFDHMSYPITIDGQPASYSDGTVVRVKYSDTIDVGFQAPAEAALTEPQAEQIASTIDVRSTKETTKG